MTSASSDLYRLGVFASGGGSNLHAILTRCQSGEIPAVVSVVISNNSGSGAFEHARAFDVPTVHLSGRTHPDPEALDYAIEGVLSEHCVDLVVLAGYMKKLGTQTLQAYSGRIINIHPALLPAFGGKGMYGAHVHEAVIRSGARESGVTVHFVNEEYDSGPIVAQETVPVRADDTPATLAERVLQLEHTFYPAVIKQFATGQVDVQDGTVRLHRQPS